MKNLASRIIVAAFMLALASISQAAILTFDNITNNSSVQLSDQLYVDYGVLGNEDGYGVGFTFYNNAFINQKITSETDLKKYIFIGNRKCFFFLERNTGFL